MVKLEWSLSRTGLNLDYNLAQSKLKNVQIWTKTRIKLDQNLTKSGKIVLELELELDQNTN